ASASQRTENREAVRRLRPPKTSTSKRPISGSDCNATTAFPPWLADFFLRLHRNHRLVVLFGLKGPYLPRQIDCPNYQVNAFGDGGNGPCLALLVLRFRNV